MSCHRSANVPLFTRVESNKQKENGKNITFTRKDVGSSGLGDPPKTIKTYFMGWSPGSFPLPG